MASTFRLTDSQLIAALLILVLLLGIAVYFLFRRSLEEHRRYRREHRRYSRFVRNINEQHEERREIEKRRRITQRTKNDVYERDQYTCQICGISRQYFDDITPGLGDYLLLEVDHIRSVKNGGSGDDEDNLQVLCWRCNRKKGGLRTNEEVLDLIDYGIDYLPPHDTL